MNSAHSSFVFKKVAVKWLKKTRILNIRLDFDNTATIGLNFLLRSWFNLLYNVDAATNLLAVHVLMTACEYKSAISATKCQKAHHQITGCLTWMDLRLLALFFNPMKGRFKIKTGFRPATG